MKTGITATRGLAAFGLAALPLALQAQSAGTDSDESLRLNPLIQRPTPRLLEGSRILCEKLEVARGRR